MAAAVKQEITDIHDQLGVLDRLMAEIERAERRILSAAERRLVEVELAMTGSSGVDGGIGYIALVEEQKQLRDVIAEARRQLGGSLGFPSGSPQD